MEINQQQVRNWLQVTTAAGGPLAALILTKTGITEGEYTLYVSLALAILPGAIVAVWGWFSNRQTAQVAAVAQMPAAEQREALNKVDDASKVLIAKDLPGVQVHVDTQDAGTPKALVDLARGPTPDVFPMVGGPRQPTEHDSP